MAELSLGGSRWLEASTLRRFHPGAVSALAGVLPNASGQTCAPAAERASTESTAFGYAKVGFDRGKSVETGIPPTPGTLRAYHSGRHPHGTCVGGRGWV